MNTTGVAHLQIRGWLLLEYYPNIKNALQLFPGAETADFS